MQPRSTSGCIAEDELVAVLGGMASASLLQRYHQHLARCACCRELAVELVRADSGDDAARFEVSSENAHERAPLQDASPDREQRRARRRVATFEVIDLIGRGGMGIVYEAWDPTLQRRVAIKVLHRSTEPATIVHLRGEARALAALSHPNIVAIFDVGLCEDEAYLAMEHVEGETLTAWLSRAHRSWRQIVEVFVQAGRGLAAAHEAGIVHRDVKPTNILVGTDGRVRVADFGLALYPTRSEPNDGMDATGRWQRKRVGTPAYMALEQLTDGTCTAKSDQFSFCVALYEALFGARPVTAGSLDQLERALRERPITVPSEDQASRVPRRLARVVVRGLARNPEGRWPDMNALLAALERARRGHTRRPLAGACMAGLALVWAPSFGRDCTPPTVTVPDSTELRGRFERASPELGRTSASRTHAALANHTARWREQWRASCEQHRPTELHCLQERRAEIHGVLAELSDPTHEVVVAAPNSILALPEPEQCDASGRAREPRSDEIRGLRSQIAALGARVSLRPGDEASAKVTALLDRARQLGAAVEQAQALRMLGVVTYAEGRTSPAQELYTESFLLARRAGGVREAIESGVNLVQAYGADPMTIDHAQRWARHTAALLERVPDPALQANLLSALASALIMRGEGEVAQTLARRGLALAPDSSEVLRGDLHVNLGHGLMLAGRVEQALREAERAVALYERSLGIDASELVRALNLLAIIEHHRGRHDRSADAMRRALSIEHGAWGETRTVLRLRGNLAIFAEQRGAWTEALAQYRNVLRGFTSVDGPRSTNVLRTLLNLTGVTYALGRWTECQRFAERARDLAIELGHWPEAVFTAQRKLAQAQRQQGRLEEAIATWRRQLADYARLAPDDERDIGRAHGELAETLLRAGHLLEARHQIGRALERFDQTTDAEDQAIAYFCAARIEHQLGDELAAARFGDQAIEAYRRRSPAPIGYRANAAETETMLAMIAAYAKHRRFPP